MIMKPIFFGLLIILFTNIQTNAQVVETLLAIKGVIECGKEIYKLMDKLLDQTPQKVTKIMEKVSQISQQIDIMDTKMDIKLDGMLNILVDDVELAARAELMKSQLCENIDKIDNYFDKSRQYRLDSECTNRTLEKFIHAVLWSQHSLPNLLEKTNDLFLPGVQSQGFLAMIHQREMLNLNRDCDEYSSAQQQMYYTYIQLIITEIKSLTTLEQIYLTQKEFDKSGHNYRPEMEHATKRFEKRIIKYHDIFSKYMKSIPRMIRRCDLNSPQIDVDYIEMEKLSRLVLMNELSGIACPANDTLKNAGSQRNSVIGDCTLLQSTLKTCPAAFNSTREFIWWHDDKSKVHYGPDTQCENTELVRSSLITDNNRDMCVCSEDRNNVMMISMTEQFSNIHNDMVVTGVKFVMLRNVLYLQIQQTNFSHEGLVHGKSEWKDVDSFQYAEQANEKLESEFLTSSRKAIHLDDIAAPAGYAVTGVRFRSYSTGFTLEVHATEYNFTSGKLYPLKNFWRNGFVDQINPTDLKRQREEVKMIRPGDPTTCSSFEYDLQSKKKIRFTHSDMNKDAGQTTVPLLDAQPVETKPPFPLGGIGLSFKGKEGFGGYIAPRIFTYDVTEHIKYEGSPPRIEPVVDAHWR